MNQICSETFTCPVEAVIKLIGGKYKAIILWHLTDNTLRYNELHKRIPKATDKMLAQQLRELERDGLINRTVYPVVPPKTEYSLTDFGRSFAPVLDAMCDWGYDYLKNINISVCNKNADSEHNIKSNDTYYDTKHKKECHE